MESYFYHHDHLKRYLSSKMAVFFPAMVGLAILFGISIVSSSAVMNCIRSKWKPRVLTH